MDVEDMRLALEDIAAARMQRDSLFGDTNIDQMVHGLPLFEGCRHSFVEAVLHLMRKAIVRPGQFIVDEDSHSPNSMFLVVCGTAEVTRKGDHCRTLTAGSYFGTAQVLGIAQTWQFSVQAKSACMMAELSRHAINSTIQEHPEEAKYFGGIIQWRSRWHNERDELSWKALQHCASLRNCSPELLKELEAVAEKAIYFPGEEISREGDEDQSLVILDRGAVSIEISGRAVRMEEVPATRTRLSYSEELGMPTPFRKARPPSGTASVASSSHGASVHHHPSDNFLRHSLNAEDRHILWQHEGLDDRKGHTRLDLDEELPEAATLGEATFLGICSRRSATMRANKMCGVRILQRPAFLRVLAKYPRDQALLEPFMKVRFEDAFSLDWVSELPIFRESGLSEEFFNFLQGHLEHRVLASAQLIVVDSLRRNVHPPLPDSGNLSACRINSGSVQLSASGRMAKRNVLRSASEASELGPGSVVMGDVFWRKSLRALETCYVSILHRGVVARALEELQADRNLYLPVLRRAQEPKLRALRNDRVARILNDRSIFSENSQPFIDEVVKQGKTRVFMPGDRIIEQDTIGTSMFILWAGNANVVKEQDEEGADSPVRVLTSMGTLVQGSVFGELVMLGMQPKRTASIISSSICCTWEVEQKDILAIFARHPAERRNFQRLMEEHLQSQAAPRIMYHQLFTCFHQPFRTWLGTNCDRKLYFPGEIIIQEGTVGDRLYIINLGTCSVELHHQLVMQVKGGSHFGFPMICKDADEENRYPVTLKSETMCQVLVVSRALYQHALQKFPDMREVAKAMELEERYRARKQRECFAQMIERRNGMRVVIDALRGSLTAQDGDQPACRTLIEAVFHGWHGQTLRSLINRQEEEEQHNRNSRRIEEWLLRRRTQMAQVKPRLELKQLIDENLSSRGPLKYSKRITCVNTDRSMRQASYRDLEDSPYHFPSPIWRRPANGSRQSSRLPPLMTARSTMRSEQHCLDEFADYAEDHFELDESALMEIPGHGHLVVSSSVEDLHKRISPATASFPGSLVVRSTP